MSTPTHTTDVLRHEETGDTEITCSCGWGTSAPTESEEDAQFIADTHAAAASVPHE